MQLAMPSMLPTIRVHAAHHAATACRLPADQHAAACEGMPLMPQHAVCQGILLVHATDPAFHAFVCGHPCATRLTASYPPPLLAHLLPQTEKGGEDAFCICLNGLGAIGVADGVSGWAEEGIDPAEYSRSLMRCGCREGSGVAMRCVYLGCGSCQREDDCGKLSRA
eukprot:264403-Chlamydomonas_euryale.AAC.1